MKSKLILCHQKHKIADGHKRQIMPLLLYFLIAIGSIQSSFAQDCPATWATNDPILCLNQCGIHLTAEGGKIPNVSNNNQVKMNEDSEINFSVRFSDPDVIVASNSPNCNPSGFVTREVPGRQYLVSFSTNNPDFSSFDPIMLVTVIDKNVTLQTLTHLEDPNDPNSIVFGFNETESPATLYIANNWGANDPPIVVTATISDNTALPNGHAGNVQDDPISTTWIINYLDVCPQGIARIDPPVIQNVPLGPGQLIAHYRGVPDIPGVNPDYEGVPITEVFARNANGNLDFQLSFDENDLKEKYMADNGLLSAQDYAQRTFHVGSESMFVIDNNDRFNDTHSDNFFDVGTFYKRHVKRAFIKNSMKNNRVGFSLSQNYFCPLNPNNSLGSATILKQWTFLGNGNYEFQVGKNHTF